MLALLLATVTVSAAFEGGSLGKVDYLAPNHIRCAVRGQADQNHRNRQASWYYFRLDGLPQGEFQIDFVDLVGEYNFHPGSHAITRNTRPVFSYDNQTWTHFRDDQASWSESEVRLTLRFKPERRTIWIAHMAPYTGRELQRLLDIRDPRIQQETIGKSVHGRDIALLTITDPAVAAAGKHVVWLMGRQHAWEAGTSWVADGAVRFLLSRDPAAVRLRRSTIFKVMPIFDPDGVAEGAVRFNANGYDNNRNWDTADPKLMPEIAAARRSMLSWLDAGHPIDIFLTLHNTEAKDYVEGPVNLGILAIDRTAGELVQCLRSGTNFHDPASPRESIGHAPIDKGRLTVNQYLFRERHVAAFLMELMVERHPALGRLRMAQDFTAFGEGLAKCLAGSVP